MKFRASFCDPFEPLVKEIGPIEKDKVLPLFDSIDWVGFIDKMEASAGNNIHYSPSLEIENIENRNGLSVSIVTHTEWYVFFKRPKKVKKFFGLKEAMNENYLSDITGQTLESSRECIEALLKNDLDFLENKIK